MKNKQLCLYWLYIFILCAALGFIQDRGVLLTAALFVLCLGFFVPPALLLHHNRTDRRLLLTLAFLGIASLVLTAVLFIAYWYALASSGSDLLANVMHAVLAIFSAPMMCAPWPALSMFLWACLSITAFSFLKKAKNAKK